jgi:hypothetical protein
MPRARCWSIYLLAPRTEWTFYLFAAGLGLTWLATVPPTAGVVGKLFGVRYLATLFGLTLLSHQIGGFLGAWLGGLALARFGDYLDVVRRHRAGAVRAAAKLVNLPIREANCNSAPPKGRPIRVGLIGAGKFGSMYLAQVPRTPGVHLVASPTCRPRPPAATWRAWAGSRARPPPASTQALRDGNTCRRRLAGAGAPPGRSTSSSNAPATRSPRSTTCLEAFAHGKHVVNVTVEADAFCGPLLARNARPPAGVVYSLAFGDQPALICDLVDWARTCGFPVVAAGRGHKWLPHFSESTPDTVWGYYGLTPEQAGARRPEPEDVQQLPRRQQAVASRAPRWPTPPGWPCPATACSTRRPASRTSPSSRARAAKAACWSARAWSR